MAKRVWKLLDKNKLIEKIDKLKLEAHPLLAFIVGYNIIEAYLLEMLFYSGKTRGIKKNAIEKIERLPFTSLIALNLLLGNITHKTYNKLMELNEKRNKYVHELLILDLSRNERLNRLIEFEKKLIDVVSKRYRKLIEDRASLMANQSK